MYFNFLTSPPHKSQYKVKMWLFTQFLIGYVLNWIYIMNSVYTSSFSLLLQGHPWSYFSLQEIWPQEHIYVTLCWLVGVTDVHMTVWNPTEINSALSRVASSLSGPSLCLPAALPSVPMHYALHTHFSDQWQQHTESRRCKWKCKYMRILITPHILTFQKCCVVNWIWNHVCVY